MLKLTPNLFARKLKNIGLLRELNPRPLAPKARIIPLDQTAFYTSFGVINKTSKASAQQQYI